MSDFTVIGVLEFSSIAAGIQAMDGMVKEAPVKILDGRTICPGKFLIIITGDVASVDASLTAGKRIGEGYLVDELFIPRLHKQVIPAILGALECEIWDAVGVIESFSVTSSIVAGDLAAKEAPVVIPEIRLATGMGGKSYVKIVGSVEEVEAAMKAGAGYVKTRGLLCKEVIIPRAHPDIKAFFL
ncbi:MAG: propanediol utilization protein [Spirochaetes bacterium]|nr:MAG: propanediol utilization protein [Spirochaetota bacterium]